MADGKQTKEKMIGPDVVPNWDCLAACSEDWFWETDQTGLLTWVDAKTPSILGVGCRACLGLGFWDLMLPEDSARFRREFAVSVVEARPIKGFKAWFRTSSGQSVCLQSNAAPRFSAEGFTGYSGASRPAGPPSPPGQSPADHRALLRGLALGVLETDSKGRIVFANPALERLFGNGPGELAGQFLHELAANQADRGRLRKRLDYLVAVQPAPASFQELLRRKDGGVFEARLDWDYRRDQRGEVIGFVSVVSDVTRDVQRFRNLAARQGRYRTLLEGLGEGLCLAAHHPEGKHQVLEANQAFWDLTGAAKGREEGSDPREALAPEDLEFIGRVAAKAVSSRRPVEFFWETRAGSGLAARLSPVFDQLERPTHLVLAVREKEAGLDKPDTIGLEAQLAQAHKMETIGMLAGGIAHDFNNILAAMLGYSELALARVKDDPKTESYLMEVSRAGDRARQLIRQILSFSRPSEQNMGPLRLGALVKEALKLVRSSLPATVELNCEVDDQGKMVWADAGQMHQVLLNLMTNAAQAVAMDGRVHLELGPAELGKEALAHPDLSPGCHMRLSVTDHGMGMSPETRERIFEPFFTTKSEGQGTGMGLSVVLGIVKAHKGVITVDSRPGSGSCFTVYLPVYHGEPARREEPAVKCKAAPTGCEHILFLDDEDSLVEIAHTMLSRLGYRVTTTTSPLKGLELFSSQPQDFDLVISDQTMPKMTGSQLACKLLTIRPDIPIIICTGYTGSLCASDIESLGVKRLMYKPLEVSEFATQVREVLDQAKTREEPMGGATLH